MRRIPTALCLAFLSATFLACAVRVSPPSASPPAGAPVALSARQLAQELYDDTSGTSRRYAGQFLQVEGVVSALERPSSFQEPGPQDPTGSILFKVPVTGKKTSATKEYVIRCMLEPPLSPEQRKAAGLAPGKTVTLRGRILAADLSNPQAGLDKCTLVTEGARR
jgi:hypothetical protein